jgi:hypothetical protein
MATLLNDTLLENFRITGAETWDMYQIVGVKRSLSIFGITCGVVVLLWAAFWPPGDPSAIGQWWKVVSGSVGFVSLLLWIVGGTSLFPFVCRLPIVRSWLPDIDGQWRADLESNWAVVATRLGAGPPPPFNDPVRARVTIKSRLLFIRVNVESEDNYSRSRSIFVRATRDEEDGTVQVSYLYENTTSKPEQTDSSTHNGAARLNVISRGGRVWMEGTYWTDRNWQNGLNTAGRITLRRN